MEGNIILRCCCMKRKTRPTKAISALFSGQEKNEEIDQAALDKPIPSQQKHKKNGFAQYSFFPELFLNIMMNGLKQPTPVQRKTLPLVLEGKDVVACYKTGSGKTLSYLLPIINKLRSHSQIVGARALILIPTRDLAEQITTVLKSFLRKIDLRYSLILGGHTYEGQFESLSVNPDIIIATPGRLLQLLNQTELKLTRIQMIIFDEADQLLGQHNFQNELKEILSKCPSSQRLMFSATITNDLNEFAIGGLRDYSYVHQQIALPDTMALDFFVVRPQQKIAALLYLLEHMVGGKKAIVFVSTRFHVDYLLSMIGELYECQGVYGKMDMEQRTAAMQEFRRKKKSILIVTDVAARGLDIPEVGVVIHFDYPANQQIFVHRSGRTARANQEGATLALITHHELAYLIELASFVGKKLINQHTQSKQCIKYGTVPPDTLAPYIGSLTKIQSKNSDLEKQGKLCERAFERFKKCRSQASANSQKRTKTLPLSVHPFFKGEYEEQTQSFMERIHKFAPKRCFLEMQKVSLNEDAETDGFLGAVAKMRKEQKVKIKKEEKKQEIRESRSLRWRQILEKQQVEEFEQYREQKNKQRAPISFVEGVNIEVEHKLKKSQQKDFKKLGEYISANKDAGEKTEFDDLPRIKTNQIDTMIQDENPQRRVQNKKVWDKSKKNFVWQRDQEDKGNKEEKGKKAYLKWKKKSKLSIPKVGEVQNEEQVGRARDNWKSRRKARHGWKETKNKGESRGRNLKNNKTKAIEKKFKKRLISRSEGTKGKGKGKGIKGKGRGRGR